MGTLVRHDWIKLKGEFFLGDWTSVASFLQAKGMKVSGGTSDATKGWGEEKAVWSTKALEKAKHKAVDSEYKDLQAIRVRQARLARLAQLKAAKKIESLDPDTLGTDEARKLLQTGLSEERKALGMSEGNQNMTQINIGTGPRTNLDKMIEGASYEQLLGLIAELKRDRERRALPEAASSSTGQVAEGEVL